jgi:hypothetical protein
MGCCGRLAIAVVTADLERPSILTGGLKRLARARVNEALTGGISSSGSTDEAHRGASFDRNPLPESNIMSPMNWAHGLHAAPQVAPNERRHYLEKKKPRKEKMGSASGSHARFRSAE